MKEEIEHALAVCQARRDIGREKYGDNNYIEKNMYQELREELYDIINYALFEIIKINSLEDKKEKLQDEM